MAKKNVVDNYDGAKLKAAMRKKFSKVEELANTIGKSNSWINGVLNKDGMHRASEQELRLLCAVCGLDYEEVLLPEEVEEEPVAVAPVAPAPVAPAPQVVIQQNITLTTEQWDWIKDAYQQLRKDADKRMNLLLESINGVGTVTVDIRNMVKRVTDGEH